MRGFDLNPKPLCPLQGRGLIVFGQRPPYAKVLVRLTEPLPLRVSLGLFIGWRDDDLLS